MRHRVLALVFLVAVILPTLLASLYMWTWAKDQYVSTVSFSVRQEEAGSNVALMGGLAQLGVSGTSAADTDILYDYLQSEDLVARLDASINLKERFSSAWPEDFVFAYDPSGTIENLADYWQRQVHVLYDNQTKLITLRVQAFTPDDALIIADAAFDESSRTINRLSDIARQDATRYAGDELLKSQQRLTEVRQAMTAFRIRTQIVDPVADLAGQMGVLTSLQSQLAQALVTLDTLLVSAQETDPRVEQAHSKIDAIKKRIAEERAKFSDASQGDSDENYAHLMAEYEKLAADLEFAEVTYRSAQANYDLAVAEGQRQSRYLAAHITPRMAQTSTVPNRILVVASVFGVLLLGWATMLLIYYSVRDRR
ncbi:capsule biosynthesis protein [Aliiroseovarius halocynthiae]|uniref:Capsule biosynthesis protein n=1 Tax=Aliiroseovarius halocynthiae TaxID=985055 RepID=A0A545SYC1_9RHOB|nr:capsule biosynthesis protein [Aliiroseovarius halocynthiae]TQV69964.1 capsule biosynthesis protein [Aliiroseovarius halocynthiae]